MTDRLRTLFVCFWLSLVWGCGSGVLCAGGWIDGIVYAETPERELVLRLRLPGAYEGLPPLLVYIHGGSWLGGSHEIVPFEWLVDEGYALASITYRFSNEAIFPAQIHDCKAAIRWLRANADEFGYDPERIAVIGISAGAHLAILLGAGSGIDEMEGGVGAHCDVDSSVRAVVSYFGASDFFLRSQSQPERTMKPGSVVYRLLGGSPVEREESAKLASGAFHVNEASAPIHIFHGDKDPVVLLDQSERLHAAYQALGLDSTLHVEPGAAHSIQPFMDEPNKDRLREFLKTRLK